LASVESSRTRVATLRDPNEVALVKAIFGAHGIELVIVGENHASMLGGLGGAFISLDVWVDGEDAEEASELIRQLREGAPPDEDAVEDDDGDDAPSPHWELEKRRRVGVSLLLSFCITFGTGHMYAGYGMRGIALLALEVIGLFQLGVAPQLGAALAGGAIILDAIGSTLLIRRDLAAQQLPPARIARIGRGDRV
jgi:TM2 domain-containing membrane protein YozV